VAGSQTMKAGDVAAYAQERIATLRQEIVGLGNNPALSNDFVEVSIEIKESQIERWRHITQMALNQGPEEELTFDAP